MIEKYPENLHNFYFALFLFENNISNYKHILDDLDWAKPIT